MTYALVPDGFTLKKVSKGEEEAIKDHRRHEDFKTFLDNETTPILMGGAALVALTPIVFSFFLKLLEEQNITVTDQQKEILKNSLVAAGPVGWGLLSLDKLRDLDFDSDIFRGWKFGGLG